MRVFVTGGTGLIGGHVVDRLIARGDQAVVLTRRPDVVRQRWGDRCTLVTGDPAQAGPWIEAMDDCDAVVNLAGQGLFETRWNAPYKELLRSSRLRATGNVAQAMANRPRRSDGTPRVLASGSAIGYYGAHGDEDLDETTPAGTDFLAQLANDWEQAARPAADAGVRLALLRTGIVLDASAGALKQMLPPFRMFVGGPIGPGSQYMSWIHSADMVGLILFILDQAAAGGPINMTAPTPVTNRAFAQALGQVLHRPSFLPTPAFALRVMLGESADVIATGQRVFPRRALELGYSFQFPEIGAALHDLLTHPKSATGA